MTHYSKINNKIIYIFLASKAKSLADKAANMYDEPNTATNNKKISSKDLNDAVRTIQREESKIRDGETPPDGAGIIIIIT